MNSVRYPNKCYKILRNLDESGRKTWASKVMDLLFRNGLGYVWLVEDVGNQKYSRKRSSRGLLIVVNRIGV